MSSNVCYWVITKEKIRYLSVIHKKTVFTNFYKTANILLLAGFCSAPSRVPFISTDSEVNTA